MANFPAYPITMNPTDVIEKAKRSNFWRWVLNKAQARMIPFNSAHGFEVAILEDYYLKARLPYKRSNFNHIRGLHACALATLSEFTTGFLLASRLDPKRYRLILQRLEMDYLYQGKMDASADFRISEVWLNEHIYQPLTAADAVTVRCEVKIHDTRGNHLTTGQVLWQVKDWAKVRTKA